MDRKFIALLAAGVAVMAVTFWIYLPARGQAIPPRDRAYLHCPACLWETIYSEKAEDDGCPKCEAGARLVTTRESVKAGGAPPNSWAPMVAPLLVEFNLLLVAVLWYAYRARNAAKEDAFLYTECGKCEQRLRYLAEKIGRAGVCPRCRRGLVFPPAAEEEKHGGAWWNARSWWKRLRGTA